MTVKRRSVTVKWLGFPSLVVWGDSMQPLGRYSSGGPIFMRREQRDWNQGGAGGRKKAQRARFSKCSNQSPRARLTGWLDRWMDGFRRTGQGTSSSTSPEPDLRGGGRDDGLLRGSKQGGRTGLVAGGGDETCIDRPPPHLLRQPKPHADHLSLLHLGQRSCLSAP